MYLNGWKNGGGRGGGGWVHYYYFYWDFYNNLFLYDNFDITSKSKCFCLKKIFGISQLHMITFPT